MNRYLLLLKHGIVPIKQQVILHIKHGTIKMVIIPIQHGRFGNMVRFRRGESLAFYDSQHLEALLKTGHIR